MDGQTDTQTERRTERRTPLPPKSSVLEEEEKKNPESSHDPVDEKSIESSFSYRISDVLPVLLILIAVNAVVFYNSLDNQFVFDDHLGEILFDYLICLHLLSSDLKVLTLPPLPPHTLKVL